MPRDKTLAERAKEISDEIAEEMITIRALMARIDDELGHGPIAARARTELVSGIGWLGSAAAEVGRLTKEGRKSDAVR